MEKRSRNTLIIIIIIVNPVVVMFMNVSCSGDVYECIL